MLQSSILQRVLALLCFASPLFVFSQNSSGSSSGGIPFPYSLSTNAKTSAGVFKPDSTLVRTLWSNEQSTAGNHTSSWDGKDDAGNLMPDGNYQVKVMSNNVQYDWQGVVGNTSDSFTGGTVHNAAQMITAMAQAGSAMYFGIGYNENDDLHHKFNIGQPNKVRTTLHGGGMVIRYMASDGTKVYSAGELSTTEAGSFQLMQMVTALNANPTGQDALYTFPNGVPRTAVSGSYFTYSVIDKTLPPADSLRTMDEVTGLAVQVTGNYLFVSHSFSNRIKVYHKTTGAFIREVSVTGARQIALQGENILWAITGTATATKYSINSDGSLTATGISLSSFTEPIALAVSPDGTKIAIADRGTTLHQVKIFNTSAGTLSSTIGRNENYNNPTVYDDKFYFNNTRIFVETDPGTTHCFLQYQSDGSLWIGDYGNMRCQHFSSTGSYIDNIQYMGYSYSSQTDINNPTRIFSDFLEFEIDYSKTLDNGVNGSWKFVRNWSKNITIPTVYDNDRMRSVATLSNGRTYALYNNGSQKEIIELVPATGIRHTGLFLDNTTNSEFYSDGSQWQIGQNVIGQPTFWKRKALTGFDGNNNPQWGSYQNIETIASVLPNEPITLGGVFKRNQYTSTGIVATFNLDNGNNPQYGRGFHLGAYKNGKWLWKTSPSTHKSYQGTYPEDGAYDIGNSVNNAGTFMQTVDRNIFWGYGGEFWKGRQTNKYNHYYDNGMLVGQFGVSGDIAAESGIRAYPGMAGNPNTGTYVKIGSDIYFYHCDEGEHGGVHRWKISGLNTLQIQILPIIKSGTPSEPILDYIDLMAGLPFDDTLTNNTAGWTRFAPESDHFKVRTNYGTYKKNERDLRIFSIGQNVDCWVERELGINNGLANWKIIGQMSYPEASEYGDNFIEVLDGNDRIIVRFSRPQYFPNLELKANSNRIAFGRDVFTIVNKLNPLSIVANGSLITVNYASYNPVIVSVFDPLANVANPKTLRFYTVSHPSGHQINVARLKFYKNFGLGSGHFRSKITGLWKNTGTWQSSPDSTNWVDATTIPDSSSNSITIQNGHTITLTDTAVVDQLMVQGGAGFRVAPNALLIVNDGTGNDITIAGSANMIIQSDATGTGKIGKSSGNISGNVTVERYISSNNNKAYRLLASSVNTAGGPKPYIRSNWQEGQNNMSIMSNSNIAPNYGIHITGNMLGNNGFDATALGLPSMLYYNQAASSQDWAAIANTDATNFDAKKGYLVYIRGDRSTDLHTNTTSSNTTLRTTGAIASGTQVYSGQEGNGRNSLVTNPYACPVDWNVIYNDASTSNAANFENYYTYWDPNVGLSGGYVTVNANGTKSAATNATTEIQPGQAFFIKAKPGAASPAFTIKENHKSGTANLDIYRTGAREQFRSSLYFSDANGVRKMADAVNAVFDTAFSPAIDGNDAEEMANWDENVGIIRATKMLSIEGRPLIDFTDTLQLSVQRLKMQNYEWQFEPMNFAQPNLKAYLEDKFLNTRTQMNLTGITVIPFTVMAVPASSATDRFRIVFSINSSLPVTMLSLKAYQKSTGIQVDWTTGLEINVDRYEIEKSEDGRQFIKAGVVLAAGSTATAHAYAWFDQNPKEGSNYYRIKTIDRNGAVTFSVIVNVKTGAKKGSFEVYPNPVSGNYLTIQFNSIAKGTYTVNLINAIGQKVMSSVINHPGNSASQSISISEKLPAGNYQLQINGMGTIYNKKIVK